jgi:hypothetical protein
MQYGVDVFADLTKEGNEPHVQRTAYRLLNILGAHGTLSLPFVHLRSVRLSLRPCCVWPLGGLIC